jgi:hypothetical protein
MPIVLTDEEIEHLKALAAAGEHGRGVTTPTPRSEVSRLVEAGYVIEQTTSVETVLYIITDEGREALGIAVRIANS